MNTRFSADVIEEAIRKRRDMAASEGRAGSRRVARGTDTWNLDTNAEFLAEYRKGFSIVDLSIGDSPTLWVAVYSDETRVTIESSDRLKIEELVAVFDRHCEESKIPLAPQQAPVVFIGHGRNDAWRDLKDHLQDQHDYEVIAYETARAGHAIRDVLDEMTNAATFAILVMTGEDEVVNESKSTELQARPNVIHETGLFQGRLGWDKAIIISDTAVSGFSNLQGIHQLRFENSIKETFGDVLATLRREFAP